MAELTRQDVLDRLSDPLRQPADLTGLDLSDLSLAAADFQNANLQGARLDDVPDKPKRGHPHERRPWWKWW